MSLRFFSKNGVITVVGVYQYPQIGNREVVLGKLSNNSIGDNLELPIGFVPEPDFAELGEELVLLPTSYVQTDIVD